MYGLKQATVLYQYLSKLLKAGGYMHILNSLGLWKYKTKKLYYVYVLMTLESNNILKIMRITSMMKSTHNTLTQLIAQETTL